jgi:hypothetical protein
MEPNERQKNPMIFNYFTDIETQSQQPILDKETWSG